MFGNFTRKGMYTETLICISLWSIFSLGANGRYLNTHNSLLGSQKADVSGTDFIAVNDGAGTPSWNNYLGRLLTPLQQIECKFVKFYIKAIQQVNI